MGRNRSDPQPDDLDDPLTLCDGAGRLYPNLDDPDSVKNLEGEAGESEEDDSGKKENLPLEDPLP